MTAKRYSIACAVATKNSVNNSKNYVAVLLLVAAWLVFFSPLLVGGEIYFADDLKILYVPIEHWYAQAQRAWELPVWSPYFGFGQPTIAWSQLGFFTPLHLLLRALSIPPLELLQVSVMAYFAIGLAGMFLFLRRHVSSLASTLGSLVFVFSGFTIGHLNHVNFYTATMVLPLLLLAIDYFTARPTLRRAVGISLLGASMALSGQPQIVAYSFGIALIVALCLGGTRLKQLGRKPRTVITGLALSLLATVLAVCLASFAILPLYEFLPLTERSGDLPETELLEFSYPPYHSITLIFPYFFGNYEHYAGPKSFQELAAFVGVIPLLLAGIGLFQGKKRGMQIAAWVLLVSGLILMLGRYSPLYTWLVHHKIITSLNVPGRFVFWFDAGIAIAAALGLDHLVRGALQTRRQRLTTIVSMVFLPLVVLTGFFWQIQFDTALFNHLLDQVSLRNPSWWLLWIGLGLVVTLVLLAPRLTPKHTGFLRFVVVAWAGTSLVIMAGNFNPRTSRQSVGDISPFIDTLNAYRTEHGQPARLYSDETILAQLPTDPSTHYTERIGPNFTIYQEVIVRKVDTACLQFPARVNRDYFGTTRISLHREVNDTPIESLEVLPESITSDEFLSVCFAKLPDFASKKVVLSFVSDYLTPYELQYTAYSQADEPVYFVRKPRATPEQLLASRKPARLIFTPLYPTQGDPQGVFLARHLNVLGSASSARWISALSVGTFRDFIQYFFANDGSAVDGDGVHALVRFRAIFNMVGVTHLIQTLPLGAEDGLLAAGFTPVESRDIGPKEVRLYTNPEALPKAFFIRRAFFKSAADETRYALQHEPYHPMEIGYITGSKPPPPQLEADQPLTATATIVAYQSTRVDVSTTTSRPAFLVVSDTTTPQWRTFIDDQPADYYVGNTIFKAALVPAGTHRVSFRYDSPAINASKKLTLGGIVAVVLLMVFPPLWSRVKAKTVPRPATSD